MELCVCCPSVVARACCSVLVAWGLVLGEDEGMVKGWVADLIQSIILEATVSNSESSRRSNPHPRA